MATVPRLIVFAPSHYGERARWALDRAGVVYREERWAPGPHAVLARRLGLRATTTPILDLGDGRPIQGSGSILDWTGLAGADPALERQFEPEIGPLVRQFVYAALLGDPRSGVRDVLLAGTSPRQAAIGRLIWPGLRRLMMQGMQAKPALLPDLTARMADRLAWFERVVRERGPHLSGAAFGRADLTAASLLAPLAAPAGCPVRSLYREVRFPPAVADTLARWREEPALTWVAEAYARSRSVAPRPGTEPSNAKS
jgi:glutathione S-transferase